MRPLVELDAMITEVIQRMQSQFDGLAQTHPEEIGLEFWFARDLQEPLGYARWENFLTAIRRAIESCKTTGYEAEHHFRGVTKLITHGKGSERSVEDFKLTRLHSTSTDSPDLLAIIKQERKV